MFISGNEEAKAAGKVIKSMNYFRYGQGDQANAFEALWTKYIGAKETVVTTSGTASLQVALMALGIGPGDSVLVPAYTYIATPLAITSVGAIPIYVDVDEQLTFDVADAAKKIRKHTKAVIPVHMVGMPCNMNGIKKLAREHGLKIIEDTCQAAGGSYRGKKLGSIGDAGAYSFNQFKIISCGEGGCTTINDRKVIQRARNASDGGLCVWEEGQTLGDDAFCAPSYRFNNINASILLQQAKRLDGILKTLRTTRQRFMKAIQLPDSCSFVTSHDEDGNCGVCFLIACESVEQAMDVEAVFKQYMGVYRPINSGRHIYSDWRVINEKRGGHHPGWDCFKHPANAKIKTNYDQPLKKSDKLLAQTVLVRTPYGLSAKETTALAKKISKGLNG